MELLGDIVLLVTPITHDFYSNLLAHLELHPMGEVLQVIGATDKVVFKYGDTLLFSLDPQGSL